MNNTPTRLRDAGYSLISPGFGQPKSGSIRTAHVAAEWNKTLCGRTLSEPARLSQRGYLHSGNHRFAFPIGGRKAGRIALPGLPYPKKLDRAA